MHGRLAHIVFSPARLRYPAARDRQRCFARWLLVFWLLSPGFAIAEQRPLVSVSSGDLIGIAAGGVKQFLGVPYARAPVGELRWAPPQAAVAWGSARDASEFGAACPQHDDRFSGVSPGERSEDCLFLNIWAPEQVEAPLPVMVWLHGGAHRTGSGALPFYEGSRLAQRDAVVVTVNFRLGYLGFFAHPALAAEGGGGNYGLMDQILALQWVQENIAAFGGDPQRVTIFGESAGGADVLYLMTSSAAEGLFQRAIVQSGGGWNEPLTASDMGEQVARNMKTVGVADGIDAAGLRSLEIATLLEAQVVKREMGFGPFLDGVTVFEAPHKVFSEGRQQAVPLIIGSNSWEANLMRFFDLGFRGNLLTRVFTRIPPISRWYADRADSAAERGEMLFTDLIFGSPARWVAAEHSRRAPAWLYYFDYVRTAQRDKVPGAGHAAEIVFVFDKLDATPVLKQTSTEEDQLMASALADCWVAFAASAEPRCELADWPVYKPEQDKILMIDLQPRSQKHPHGEVLDAIQRRFGPG